MRISDWSSDVCSSDLCAPAERQCATAAPDNRITTAPASLGLHGRRCSSRALVDRAGVGRPSRHIRQPPHLAGHEPRSEEHTSELQSLMRTSYAVFCLKKKQTKKETTAS